MKKILFLLLSTVAMYGQVPADATPLENIQITNNTQSTTATKVNVQENDGTINTISKSDLVNVVEVNDVPSLPLIGEVGKIYVVKNVNKIYRWNGTFYQELAGTDISGLQAQIDLKANDSDVVKLKGNQSITGQKTFNNSSTGSGIVSQNSSTGSGIFSSNNSTGDGIFSQNSSTGFGIFSQNSSTGFGIFSSNNSTGSGIVSDNSSTGFGIFSSNSSTGDGIVSRQTGTATGFNYVGQNNGTNTFTVNKLGATTATSFINSTAPANNILLAGGGDLAQASLPVSTATQTALNGKENIANKQNSLAVDGTGSKYPTVDAVNASIPSSIYSWGDSMTFGTGSTAGNDYPSIFSKYVNWKTINKGVPGNTSTEIKDRFVAFYTANPEELKKPVIIWAGRNNYPDGVTIKADIATMLNMLPHSNYLVLGVTNSNPGEQIGNSGYTQIVALNNDLKTIYGTNFIDIRSFLVSQYNPSIPQDVTDHSLSLPPTSLLSDNIHLNDLGYRKVASFIANHFSLLENRRVTYTDALITRNQYITGVPSSILKTGSDGLVTNSVLHENDFNLGLGFVPNSISDTRNFEFINGGTIASRVAVPQFSISSNSYGSWYAPKYSSSNFASQIVLNGAGGDIIFYTAPSGLANTNITYNRKFWIKQDGAIEINSLSGTGSRLVTADSSGNLSAPDVPTAPTATAGTNTTQIATTAFVQATKPYKVYTALLNQSGTNAPVATVLENTLGGTVVWTRNSTGLYTGTLAGVFTANKTWTSITSTATGTVTGAVSISVDAVMVATSFLDSALSNSAIEIRVYN